MKAIIGLIAVLFFLCSVNPIFAARNIVIFSDTTSLLGDQEMIITASSSGFLNGEMIYIKGAFYNETNPTSYFGFTKNGDDWVKTSASTASQRQIKIGDWDGHLTVKMDFSSSLYGGEGAYKLKVGFYYYNSNGNLTTVSWSSDPSLDINVIPPTPTPTLTPIPTQIPTNTPTPTASLTNTPNTPTPTKTLTPTPTPNISISKAVTPTAPENVSSASVLGESTGDSLDISPPDNNLVSGATKKPDTIFQVILIILGIALISACAILTFRIIKKGELTQNEDE